METDNAEPGTQKSPAGWTRAAVGGLVLLCLVQMLEAIDITVVNVGLPSIASSLDLSAASLPWVVNAYAVAFGGFLLLGGRAGDLFGRRRVLLGGIALFTAASLVSGLAPSGNVLIASRALQGIAAGFSSPMTLGMLASMFPVGPLRTRAITIWGSTAGISSSLGLVLGGLLVAGPGWRWIFFVNIPIGLFILAVAPRLLPVDRPEHRHGRFDVVGAVTATAALSLFGYAVAQTNTHGWGSARTLVLLAVGVALLAFFVVHEAIFAEDPLVPRGLLRHRPVLAANVATVLTSGGLFAMFFFTSLYQQEVLHYSALKSGLAFTPITLTVVVCSGVGGMLVPRLGVRYVVAAGSLIAAIGLFLYSRLTPDTGLLGIIIPGVVLALGFALTYVPLTLAAVTGVRREETGVASGLLNAGRQASGAIGLAVLAAIATSRTANRVADGVGSVDALSDGYKLGYLIAAATMVVAAGAALALFRDEGRGENVDLAGLAEAGVEA